MVARVSGVSRTTVSDWRPISVGDVLIGYVKFKPSKGYFAYSDRGKLVESQPFMSFSKAANFLKGHHLSGLTDVLNNLGDL